MYQDVLEYIRARQEYTWHKAEEEENDLFVLIGSIVTKMV